MIDKILLEKQLYDISKYDANNNPNKQSKKILLVENDKTLKTVHGMFLESIKINFDLAATEEEALKLFKENTYDLVLLNIELPDTLGFEISCNIRNDPKGQNIAIIALSGSGSSIKQECLEAGINDIYSIPISYNNLSNVILTNLGIIAQE
jgi:CheY-like chemotaxis protein